MEVKSGGNDKNNSIYSSSSKVEEIPDDIETKTLLVVDHSYDDLDKELENELNEMELEKELSELNDVDEIKVEEVAEDDEDDEDDDQ